MDQRALIVLPELCNFQSLKKIAGNCDPYTVVCWCLMQVLLCVL